MGMDFIRILKNKGAFPSSAPTDATMLMLGLGAAGHTGWLKIIYGSWLFTAQNFVSKLTLLWGEWLYVHVKY